MKGKRWHHYLFWEDYTNGMWRTISGDERKKFLKKAIKFTGNAEKYGSYMRIVIKEWPVACEQNLTDQNINRKAWIGHAACCYAIKCPEDITREAWAHLSTKQQDDANYQAEMAIKAWEQRYERQSISVYQQVAFTGL